MLRKVIPLIVSFVVAFSPLVATNVSAKSIQVNNSTEPQVVLRCRVNGENHMGHVVTGYPYVVTYNGKNMGYFGKSECDCGAEIYYNGYPFRSVSPYLGNYFFTYKNLNQINDYKTMEANEMYYTDNPTITGWYFPLRG